jgi:hypothetical protein
MMPSRSKYRPTAEEMQIRDWIIELLPVMSEFEVGKAVSKKLGKPCSSTRIRAIKARMMEEARSNFKNLTSFEVAVQMREQYLRMEREGWRLVLEADAMADREKSIELRLKGMDFIRKSKESEQNLYKLTGLLKEELYIYHGDPTSSPQWKKMEQAVILWMKMELREDPQKFIDFIAKISHDPNALDEYVSYGAKRRTELKNKTWHPEGNRAVDYVEAEVTEPEPEEEEEKVYNFNKRKEEKEE